jgi:hypothetical protein
MEWDVECESDQVISNNSHRLFLESLPRCESRAIHYQRRCLPDLFLIPLKNPSIALPWLNKISTSEQYEWRVIHVSFDQKVWSI